MSHQDSGTKRLINLLLAKEGRVVKTDELRRATELHHPGRHVRFLREAGCTIESHKQREELAPGEWFVADMSPYRDEEEGSESVTDLDQVKDEILKIASEKGGARWNQLVKNVLQTDSISVFTDALEELRMQDRIELDNGLFFPVDPVPAPQPNGEVDRKVVISDLHFPYVHKTAWERTLRFIEWFQPSEININGDVTDFYSISRFDKNPARKERLQQELDATVQGLEDLREVAPARQAKLSFNEGNHERRFRDYLWRHAPEIASLRSLTVPNQLEFDRFGIQYYEEQEDLWWPGDLLVTHGTIVRKYSGYSALGMYQKHGYNGLMGHTHRQGRFHRTVHGQTYTWAEIGGLADPSQAEYITNPDWQLGFAVVWQYPDDFQVELVPIDFDGTLYFQGLRW